MTDRSHDPTLDEEDVPLEEDDRLIQRYLDGTLDTEEALQVEFRIDEDPHFGARVHAYESMFAALDRSALARSAVLWSSEMPEVIVDAALSRWQSEGSAQPAPSSPTVEPHSGLEEVFGGWKPAVAAFALADVVLGALIVLVAMARGPIELLGGWVISLKDLGLFLIEHAPSPEQVSTVLAVAVLACVASLYGVYAGMRSVLARSGAQT